MVAKKTHYFQESLNLASPAIETLQTIQDVLYKMGIKPHNCIWWKSWHNQTYQNHRQPKITKFWFSKLFCSEILYWTRTTTFINEIFRYFLFFKYLLLKICSIFVGSVDNFGRSDDDMILWKTDDFYWTFILCCFLYFT